jgi:hypothetical protein
MNRFVVPLGLLVFCAAACPPSPPPTDPSNDPPPAAADASAEALANPEPIAAEAGVADVPAEPMVDEAGATAVPVEPPGDAARLLAAVDCFPRAVAALQDEPREGESLEAFMARGLERLRADGPLPGSCGLLRPDGPAVPICAHGNPVRVERTETSRDTFEGGREDVRLRYRFDCGGDVSATTELTWSVGGE